ERFADVAPATIFATLLDEGRYCGSIRTMYRLLAAHRQTGERRRQRVHPLYTKPELLATRPNEVWSWDISKLKGPAKWTCFHLFVILDIFSRYVVGWMIAHRETAELAEQLIVDELTAYGTFALLLLPESFGEAAVLQPLQHPRAFPHREIGIPNRIEWVGVR